MNKKSEGFSLDFMSKYYDLLTLTEKSSLRLKQVALINLEEGEAVLDVGCGTGAITILSKKAVGETGKVCGIDIAPKMIDTARRKAVKYKLKIDFEIASIAKLPFPDESFDVVTSSLMFHHLPVKLKKEGLREIYRVLKKSGRFLLTDFCTPGILTAPLMFLLFVWLESTRYQFFGKLPGLISESGFNNIEIVKNGLFLKYYLIRK